MRNSKRFLTVLSVLSGAALSGAAIAAPVSLSEENFAFIANAGFESHAGRDAIVLASPAEGAPFSFGAAVLKGIGLKNGTIEYDVNFGDTRTFVGANFRMQDQNNYEEFYMRAHQSGNPDANQYMPRFNGVPSWQLYYGPAYSSATTYDFGTWTPVKLEVSEDRMDVYIGDMETPAIASVLRRDIMPGGIGFWGLNLGGPAWISNINVTPAESLELAGTPSAPEPMAVGTIAEWQVSDPFDGASLNSKTNIGDMASGASYQALDAEASGLVNLARLHGIEAGKDTVFAKVSITAEQASTKQFEFGFSDDVRVYLNGALLVEASDRYRTRDYRFLGTVGYWDSVYLPLKAGENELVLAITEDVADTTGWAVQGRLPDVEGLSIK